MPTNNYYGDVVKFALEKHKDHTRKYTNEPYAYHLAEVAGIVSSVTNNPVTIAIAWLHDVIEDQGVTHEELLQLFGKDVADGVMMLSDLEQGNRATRKKASRERLAKASDAIQTIKVADLISNTKSIVEHDPNFAKVYLEEKELLLQVLTKADSRLVQLANKILKEAREN